MSYYGVREATALFDLPSFQVGDENPLIDPVRPFWEENYSLLMVPFPGADILAINNPVGLLARQQVEDRIQVPPGSWLIAVSAYSQQAAGFRYSVFDEGRKRLALGDQWMQNVATAQDNTDTDPALPAILPAPYYVVSPGWLQLRIVNSSAAANDAQVLLYFAVPTFRAGGGK